jgi:hypothetical protein
MPKMAPGTIGVGVGETILPRMAPGIIGVGVGIEITTAMTATAMTEIMIGIATMTVAK